MFLSEHQPLQLHLPMLDAHDDDLFQELMPFLQSEEPASSNSGCESLTLEAAAERKLRRMISNRESARRSRWKKKRHLENLTTEASRLGLENRELKGQLNLVLSQCDAAWGENARLRTESSLLQTRLRHLYQILVSMQCGASLS